MNKLKVMIFLSLILATCAGLSAFSVRLNPTIEGADRGQMEARARSRCGRGKRCQAGMTYEDSSAIAKIQVKEVNPG